jgi:hypothetical protein
VRAPSRITSFLERSPRAVLAVYAVVAAFGAYFCMYAFRKAFAAAKYEGTSDLLGLALDHKTVFILSQVFGYCLSKFLGIKIISELAPARRALALLGCITFAEIALVVFAVLPPTLGGFALFLNGLPLGLVWGLVFGFLEGRRTSDILGAGLCASFIVASGAVKSVGKMLLDGGVSEAWMPAATGALFFPPLVVCTFLLSRLPPPTEADEAERTARAPMDGAARRAFARSYGPGLVVLVGLYVLLTALRDFRDNFARELWDALGYHEQPSILAMAEIPVAIVALAAVASMLAIRDNRKAVLAVHVTMGAGVLLAGAGTLLFQGGAIGPAAWMIAVGAGLYVAYVPYNCVLFDRLVAASGSVATAGFLIYLCDSFGYLGSVGLLLYKNLGHPNLPWVNFLASAAILTGAAGVVLYAVSAAYFWRRTAPIASQASTSRS